MTRAQLLQLVISRARSNGFQFRRWFVKACGRPWVTPADAILWLSIGRRCDLLLFSHEFAQSFWKSGETITFQVPTQEFQRVTTNGKVITVKRKPYTRRSVRTDAWRYHMREMATSEEPLRYIRRFLMIEEDLDTEDTSLDGLKRKETDDGNMPPPAKPIS